MSQEAHIPVHFAEWIVRSLDGTITDEQFALLDREIATNAAARMYYLEFIATYVGLVDLAGVLPKPESIVGTDALSATDTPLEQLGTAPGIVERRTPKAARNHDEGALRIGADAPEQERVREIERYARQQLAAFLAEEHEQRRESDVAGGGWDLWDAVSRATQNAGRLWASELNGCEIDRVAEPGQAVLDPVEDHRLGDHGLHLSVGLLDERGGQLGDGIRQDFIHPGH